MNRYCWNIIERDYCTKKALTFLHNGNVNMFKFWASAARAFEARALDSSPDEHQTRLFDQIRSLHEMGTRWEA